jgi:glycosyltransferase involved in cell wall biosynthesis
MYKNHRVIVVMPVHNEQRHIARAVARVPDFVDLIVAVDDGSDDRTWEELSRTDNRKLISVRHETNRGVGAATRTGYRQAVERGADFVAVMDGDGQMDGRDLSPLLDCALRGADYVKGNRFLHRTISAMPITRRLGNAVFSYLTGRAAGFAGSLDSQCGYTVIRARSLRRLDLDALYDRYGFLNEMLFASLRAGLRVECVPVRAVYGDEVSGINPLTAVPRILYLIARNFARDRFSSEIKSLTVEESQAGAAK